MRGWQNMPVGVFPLTSSLTDHRLYAIRNIGQMFTMEGTEDGKYRPRDTSIGGWWLSNRATSVWQLAHHGIHCMLAELNLSTT
jgi:hypothetical protein